MQNLIKNLGSYGEYPPLMQKFIDFWTLLNAARVAEGESALLLYDGFGLADLIENLDALNSAIAAVGLREEEIRIARNELDESRLAARQTLESWKKVVAARFPRTIYSEDLPVLPGVREGVDAFLAPMQIALEKWTVINAATGVPFFTPPLLLPDGRAIAGFEGQRDTVRVRTNAVGLMEEAATNLRKTRDALLPPIKAHLEDLRALVLSLYPKDSLWVTTLPKMSEKPTTTPEGVVIKCVYEAQAGGWRLSWKAPDELDIVRFSVRIAAGPRYKSDAEKVIGDLTPQTITFLVESNEVPPGATVWAKVYVVNETGNEKGSNAVRLVVS